MGKGKGRSLLSISGKGVSKALSTEMNSDPIQHTGDTIIDLNKTDVKCLGKSDAKLLLVLKSIDWLFVLSVFFPYRAPLLVFLLQQDFFKKSKVTKKTQMYLGGIRRENSIFVSTVLFL